MCFTGTSNPQTQHDLSPRSKRSRGAARSTYAVSFIAPKASTAGTIRSIDAGRSEYLSRTGVAAVGRTSHCGLLLMACIWIRSPSTSRTSVATSYCFVREMTDILGNSSRTSWISWSTRSSALPAIRWTSRSSESLTSGRWVLCSAVPPMTTTRSSRGNAAIKWERR
jgi:hypothetical protein